MAASGGKRNLSNSLSQYQGQSASQQVYSMQGSQVWPTSGAPGGNYQIQPSILVDYAHPWFERKDGEWFCNLCHAWATDGHVTSAKHTKRAEAPEYYGFGNVDESRYDKPWFIKRDGEWYCELCKSWATDGHLEGGNHIKRETYWQSYWTPPGNQAAPLMLTNPTVAACGVAAAPVATVSAFAAGAPPSHQGHAAAYAAPANQPASQLGCPPARHLAAPTAAMSPMQPVLRAKVDLPEGWQMYFDDTGKPYYHHQEKQITQWAAPEAEAVAPPPPPPPRPTNAAAAPRPRMYCDPSTGVTFYNGDLFKDMYCDPSTGVTGYYNSDLGQAPAVTAAVPWPVTGAASFPDADEVEC